MAPWVATQAKAAALAAAVVLCAAADWDPYTLTLRFADGRTERLAATSADTCETAVRALWMGRWRPVGNSDVAAAACAPGDLFLPGSDKIVGFNDR